MGENNNFVHICVPPHPCEMLTEHLSSFHVTEVCISLFVNIERGKGGMGVPEHILKVLGQHNLSKVVANHMLVYINDSNDETKD